MSEKPLSRPPGWVHDFFLPPSQFPKELLPILDKPMIQYEVEEAADAGIEEIIIVTSRGKEALEDYFRPNPDLEQHLDNSGSVQLLEKVQHITSMSKFLLRETGAAFRPGSCCF